jgi:flavin-dependent thymidylate synthase
VKVILAGFNVDAETLKSLAQSRTVVLTPETISAAYARISRSPLPVGQLRRIARGEVAKARESNRTIVFRMGHHSVAEHAVFNFDLAGLSRLAIEEVEHFRLCSFTEKSQRYVTLTGNFVIPQELRRTSFRDLFVKTAGFQYRTYARLSDRLTTYLARKHPALSAESKGRLLLENLAKEDARYVLPLATEGQLGMTLNARNLELMLRRFASHPLSEVRMLGRQLQALAVKVTPSLILFHDPNDYDARTYQELSDTARTLVDERLRGRSCPTASVELVECTAQGDDRLVAALLHTASHLSYAVCLRRTLRLSAQQKRRLVLRAFQHLELYDAVLREFEHVSLTFNLILSASCFAQLKRHRLATLTVQGYEPAHGYVIPPSVLETRAMAPFQRAMDRSETAYARIDRGFPLAAKYILSNAHQRRVLLTLNARELYHLSRLREDASAQWEIRHLVEMMSAKARRVMPLTFLLLGGKDVYPEIYTRVFGHPPKVVAPTLPGEREADRG